MDNFQWTGEAITAGLEELERCDFKLWVKTLPRVASAMVAVQFAGAEVFVDETTMTDIYWMVKIGEMGNDAVHS